MDVRSLSALSVALVLLLPVGIVAVPAPEDVLSPAAPALPRTEPHLGTILERLAEGAGLTVPEFIPRFADITDEDRANLERALLPDPRAGQPGIAKVVPPGTIENYSGTVHISEDWIVDGTVNFVDADVIFDGPFVITVTRFGTLSVTGASSITDSDDNPLVVGSIIASGNITIEGTSSVPVTVKSVTVASLAKGAKDFAAAKVRWTRFSDGRIGLQVNNSQALLEFNTFSNMGTAFFHVPRGAAFTGASNATISNSSWVGNQRGVFYQATSGGGLPGSSGGKVQFSEFKANQFGVLCVGAGDGSGNRPNIHKNNFRNHFAEAYSGFRGVTVDVPPPGPSPGDVSVADGNCLVDGNYFASGESTFHSTSDTRQNDASDPIANSAPANPITPRVVTSAETLTLPHTLAAPIIVDDGGTLTIKDGVLDANGHLWGSGTGGRLVTSNLTIRNNGQLLVRNSNDDVDGLKISGAAKRFPLFAIGASNMHALLWRNNAVLDKWEAENFDHLMTWTAGVLVDADTYTPSFTNGKVKNGAAAAIVLFGNFAKATISDTTFENVGTASQSQLGATTFRDNTVTGAAGGLFGVIQPVTSDGSKYRNVGTGILASTAGAITSRDDDIDGGYIGIESVLASPTTITGGVFSQLNLALVNLVGGSFTSTGSTLAYNAYAVVPIADTITVTNANFRDNYLFSLYGVPADPLGTGTITPSSITCNNCYFYRADDKSYSNGGGGTITVTEAVSANSNTDPSWLSNVVVAGPGETKRVSGVLAAPAIAREGGRLLVEDTTIDGADRFVIGAKGGGNADGATGHLTLRRATLDNLRFIAVNSTDSIIENNRFTSAAGLFEVATRGTTLTCNAFDGVALPVNFLRQNMSLQDLVFRRNLIERGGGLDLGFSERDDQEAVVEENAYRGTAGHGLLDRFTPSVVTMNRNNLLGATGYADKGRFLEGAPGVANLERNYWGHASGPRISNNAGGSGAQIVGNTANVDWDPFEAANTKPALCVAFRFDPTSPTEVQKATFTDLSFAPSGAAIAKRTWSWGDGTPDLVDAGTGAVEHDFADGGTYTVTLTVETADGQVGSASRSLSVTHVAPVANLAAAVVNEVTPVAFTDTSTHPNSPQDDPPAGWAYSWDFAGEGSSALRNPSFRFADGGSKTIKLRVTDNDGLSHETTKAVSVPHVPPVASFSVAGTQETDTYVLTDTSTHPNAPTDGIASRSWSCSDGFAGSASSVSHKFADGGSYTCTLTVTDNDGQSASITKTIGVAHVAPNAAFSNGAASELQDMAFTDGSTHPNAPTDAPPGGWSYAWAFGDGATSSDRNPTRNYADGGSYTVSLTATDNDGQASTATRTVSVTHVAPVADFDWLPANPDPGEAVSFTDASTHPNAPVDAITAWSWDFGDGSTSALQNPSHAFAEQGLFNVKLTVTDDDGMTHSTTIRVPIGNLPPVAAFTWSPATPTDLEDVQFTDQSSDPDGNVASWSWAFGDGGTSTARNPVHRFADDGLYTVTLTVTDNLGAATTISKVVEVLNVAPTAGFTFGPSNPIVGDMVRFKDQSSDPDGTIASWSWDFGDGVTSTLKDPSHAFAEGGDYVVKLTVTDDDGAATTTQRTVHVCETGLDLARLRLEVCLRVDL